MIRVYKISILSVLLSLLMVSCYSFKGISIPADVQTYYVLPVQLTEFRAPPDSPERFMEQLRQTIRSQSKLRWNETDPDIEFDCTITGFSITNEGSQAGNEVSLNKLTISVKVEYISNKNEDDDWTKTFSFGIPFDASTDLQDVQDDLIEDIFVQITENIFNDAFTNW